MTVQELFEGTIEIQAGWGGTIVSDAWTPEPLIEFTAYEDRSILASLPADHLELVASCYFRERDRVRVIDAIAGVQAGWEGAIVAGAETPEPLVEFTTYLELPIRASIPTGNLQRVYQELDRVEVQRSVTVAEDGGPVEVQPGWKGTIVADAGTPKPLVEFTQYRERSILASIPVEDLALLRD